MFKCRTGWSGWLALSRGTLNAQMYEVTDLLWAEVPWTLKCRTGWSGWLALSRGTLNAQMYEVVDLLWAEAPWMLKCMKWLTCSEQRYLECSNVGLDEVVDPLWAEAPWMLKCMKWFTYSEQRYLECSNVGLDEVADLLWAEAAAMLRCRAATQQTAWRGCEGPWLSGWGGWPGRPRWELHHPPDPAASVAGEATLAPLACWRALHSHLHTWRYTWLPTAYRQLHTNPWNHPPIKLVTFNVWCNRQWSNTRSASLLMGSSFPPAYMTQNLDTALQPIIKVHTTPWNHSPIDPVTLNVWRNRDWALLTSCSFPPACMTEHLDTALQPIVKLHTTPWKHPLPSLVIVNVWREPTVWNNTRSTGLLTGSALTWAKSITHNSLKPPSQQSCYTPLLSNTWFLLLLLSNVTVGWTDIKYWLILNRHWSNTCSANSLVCSSLLPEHISQHLITA